MRHVGQVDNLRPAEVQWPGAAAVEKAIHGEERSSGGCRFGKNSRCRQAAMQPLCKKDRLASGVIMRQAASMESGHERKVRVRPQNSHGMWGRLITVDNPRPIVNRPARFLAPTAACPNKMSLPVSSGRLLSNASVLEQADATSFS